MAEGPREPRSRRRTRRRLRDLKAGWVVTDQHLVADAAEVAVRLDGDGRVIGVISQGRGDGIAFAVPVSAVERLARRPPP